MQRYRKILQFAKPHKRAFVLIFALTLLASTLAALQPWPMKLVVDNVLGDEPFPQWLNVAPKGQLLALLVAAGFALFVLNALLDAVLTWIWTDRGRRAVYDLSAELFARLQRRSLIAHSRQPVGDALSRITEDSWCIYRLIDNLLFSPLHALLALALMIFLMSRLDATLTLLAVIAAPFMVLASFILGKPLHAAARLKREIESRIQSHIQQTLTGIPVVQAFAQEDRQHERFQEYAEAVIRAQQRTAFIASLNSLSSGLVTTLGTGLVLWFGARMVLDTRLTLGGLLVFLFYLNSLQAQIKILAGLYPALQGINANADRVNEILEGADDVKEKSGAMVLGRVQGSVSFENVTFGYETAQPILRDIHLSVAPGETIAFAGATGAGKSTLVNLIPRFLDPWQGRVLVDGKDIRDLTLRSLRQNISIVLQEPFLFPFSIAENIAYGRPSASKDEIISASRAANLHEFVEGLPNGYDTMIGERGATLSGGERQRVAIARALLKDAPILILDEPTSALDAETERLVMEALERLRKGRTTFLIAHRLSTLRCADRIVVMKDGRIAESGTHAELLKRGELYAHFHSIQFAPRVKEVEVTS